MTRAASNRAQIRPARRASAVLSLTAAFGLAAIVPNLAPGGDAGADGVTFAAATGGPLALGLTEIPTAPAPAADEPAAVPAAAAEEQVPATFAKVRDLEVRLTTPTPVVHGFHEAAGKGPLGLTPVGVNTTNDNAGKYDVPEDDPEGPDYLVLPTRDRDQGATTAVDIVHRLDDPVLAPVSGKVVNVASYTLYGSHHDRRVEIIPDDQPDTKVVLLHVKKTTVEVGDHVEVGETVVAEEARLFPFPSQVDRYAGAALPHVHLEVQPLHRA